MNVRPDLERVIADWLRGQVTDEGADRVLAGALVRVARVEQVRRRGVLRPRDPIGYIRLLIAAATAATVLVVAVVWVNPSSSSASATIEGVWPSEPAVAFTVDLPADAPVDVYWRVGMFDQWSGSGRSWRPSASTRTSVEAGTSIDDLVREPFAAGAVVEISASITLSDAGDWTVAPGIPVTVDQPIEIESTGSGGSLVGFSLSTPSETYRVTGVRLAVESATTPQGVSAAKLAAAGTDYPPEIMAQFATPPEDDELGGESLAFIRDIREVAGDNPYRIAALMEEQFRSPRFTYDADVRDVDCGGQGFTECFMQVKRGYCEYYATAMIMLLRQQGIPARFVTGFLPGERIGTVETVRVANVHTWVEVYFPRWGWWTFDPTPRGTPRTLPR